MIMYQFCLLDFPRVYYSLLVKIEHVCGHLAIDEDLRNTGKDTSESESFNCLPVIRFISKSKLYASIKFTGIILLLFL